MLLPPYFGGLYMICPKCSVKNSDKAKFCDECGTTLTTNVKSTKVEIKKDESVLKKKLKTDPVKFFKMDLSKPIIFGTLSMLFAYYVISIAKSAPHPIYMISISNFFIGLGGFLAVVLTDSKKLESLLSALITAVITVVLISLHRLIYNPHNLHSILYLLGLLCGNSISFISYSLIGGVSGLLIKNIYLWIKRKFFP